MIEIVFWGLVSIYSACAVVSLLFARRASYPWFGAVVIAIFWPLALYATMKVPRP